MRVNVGSVNTAIRVRKLLIRNGISSDILKSDGGRARGGCTYGVTFDGARYFDVVGILRDAGIGYTVSNE